MGILKKTALISSLCILATHGLQAQMIATEITEPVTIKYYNYNLASAGLGAEGTRKLLDEFAQEYPNIKVEAVGVSSDQVISRLQSDIAIGQGPDVAQVVFSDLDFAANSLGAQDLNAIIPSAEWEQHVEGVSENGLNLGRIGDKIYALAYTFSTPILFYNADIFRAAGLDPDQPPQTWDEVLETAQIIEEKTDYRGFDGGIVGAGSGGSDWLLQGIIRSNDGRVLSEDRKTLTFAEPESIEAIQMLRKLYEAGVYRNEPFMASIEAMIGGQTGMNLTSSVLQSAFLAGAKDNFELRSALMPRFGDKPTRPTNSGSGLVIFTTDPVKQRAAWEFMKFMTSKRAYTVITSEIGYLPLRTDIVNDPEYLKGWVESNPLIEPNLEQLSRLEPWQAMPGPNYRQVVLTMLDAMERAVFGGEDIEQTLLEAQTRAQSYMPAQ